MVTIIFGILWTIAVIIYENLKDSGVWDDGWWVTIKHPITKEYVDVRIISYGEMILFGSLFILGIICAVKGI